jgi:hypothetical protein
MGKCQPGFGYGELSGRVRDRPFFQAIEKDFAERFLDLSHRVADRGLRAAKPLRRNRKALRLFKRHQGAELSQSYMR